MRLSEVYEGWRNNLFPPARLKEVVKRVGEERMAICQKCPLFSENKRNDPTFKSIRIDEYCTHCGCPLAAKTKCLSCKCPIGKWSDEVTETEEETIKQGIDEKS